MCNISCIFEYNKIYMKFKKKKKNLYIPIGSKEQNLSSNHIEFSMSSQPLIIAPVVVVIVHIPHIFEHVFYARTSTHALIYIMSLFKSTR